MNISKTGAVIAGKVKNAAVQGKQYAAGVINKHSADSFLFTNKKGKNEALKYLHSMFVKITPEDVAAIEKANKENAAKYCYNLVCKSMEIPEDIAPEFTIRALYEEAPKMCGMYDYMTNELKYFSKSKGNTKLGKWWTFGLLRHEMEHFRQNIDMLRSKDITKKLCNYYNDEFKKAKWSKEDITEYFKALKDFQNKVLKHYPPIKTGSREYKHAEKFLQDRTNYTLGTNGIMDRLHYFIQPVEFEACMAQGFNWVNYLSSRVLHRL